MKSLGIFLSQNIFQSPDLETMSCGLFVKNRKLGTGSWIWIWTFNDDTVGDFDGMQQIHPKTFAMKFFYQFYFIYRFRFMGLKKRK